MSFLRPLVCALIFFHPSCSHTVCPELIAPMYMVGKICAGLSACSAMSVGTYYCIAASHEHSDEEQAQPIQNNPPLLLLRRHPVFFRNPRCAVGISLTLALTALSALLWSSSSPC